MLLIMIFLPSLTFLWHKDVAMDNKTNNKHTSSSIFATRQLLFSILPRKFVTKNTLSGFMSLVNNYSLLQYLAAVVEFIIIT